MKQLTIRLDEQVHTFFVNLAAERQVSLSRLINDTLERFVRAEQAFAMMESRASRSYPGALRRVLDHNAAYRLTPLQPEDQLPADVDRHLLESRLKEAGSQDV